MKILVEFESALIKALKDADFGAQVVKTELRGRTRINGEFDLRRVARAVMDECCFADPNQPRRP